MANSGWKLVYSERDRFRAGMVLDDIQEIEVPLAVKTEEEARREAQRKWESIQKEKAKYSIFAPVNPQPRITYTILL